MPSDAPAPGQARLDNVSVIPDIAKARPLYRVRLGPLPDVAAYDQLVDRLHSVAIDDIYLTLN
jgi:hypothetical protein